MLKKKLGIEAIESDWGYSHGNIGYTYSYFKIPSFLIIPENVVEIGYRAFSGCDEIKKVVIPKNVRKIGVDSFYECRNLKELELAEGVLIIDNWAFAGCTNLKKAVIPDSALMVGECVFTDYRTIKIESKKPTWLFISCADSISSRVTITTPFKLNFRFIRRYFRYFKELIKFFFSSKSLIYEKNINKTNNKI